MRRLMMMAASLLLCSGAVLLAKDKVTVEATSEDISEGLDLKAVANLFGDVKDLSEFEEKLNSEKLHLCNLDLNGDGQVDYLRVVESEDGKNVHLVLIQAVLAKDIYQDIATIYVESQADKSVTVQVIGDAYIYGANYVIEPVYIYRPMIYDWFWGPGWVCYTSPWYWGYWPGWYAPYPCWGYRTYWTHVHVYHYDHPVCSYRYARAPHDKATSMRNYSSRSDYASANASRNFSSRTGMTNARDLSSARVSSGSRGTTAVATRATSTSARGASSYTSGTVSASRGSSYTTSYSSGSRGSSYTTSYSSGSRESGNYSGSSRGTSSYTPSYSGSSSRGSSGYSSYSGGSSRGSSSYSGGSSSGSGRGSSSSGGSYSGGSRR